MAYDNYDPSPGGGLQVPSCVFVGLLGLMVVALLVWGLYSVGQWGFVQIEQARAKAEARKAEQAWAAAEAEKARQAGETERAEIALERERVEGINAWIDSLAARMNAATLLPFTPAIAALLILAGGIGWKLRGGA